MTTLVTTRGVQLVLKVGDGASPEVFTALCSINAERGLKFSAPTREQLIPDGDDPDKSGWVAREKESLSLSFSGGGMLHRTDVARMQAWWDSEDAKTCQVVLDDEIILNVLTFTGRFVLTQFEIKGESGTRVKAAVSLESDGYCVFDGGSLPPDGFDFLTWLGEILTHGNEPLIVPI